MSPDMGKDLQPVLASTAHLQQSQVLSDRDRAAVEAVAAGLRRRPPTPGGPTKLHGKHSVNGPSSMTSKQCWQIPRQSHSTWATW